MRLMNESNAEEGTYDASASAENTGAAEDDGGDDVEFEPHAGGGLGGVIACGVIDRDDARHKPGERVDGKFHPVNLESGEAGGGFVVTDGIQFSAERSFGEDDGHDDGKSDEDPTRDGDGVPVGMAQIVPREKAGLPQPSEAGGEAGVDRSRVVEGGETEAEALGDAAEGGEGCEGDDEGVDVEFGDEEAVDRAAENAGDDGGGRGGPDRPVSELVEHAHHDRGEGHGGADGKIDAAGDDDEGHGEGEEGEVPCVEEKPLLGISGNEFGSDDARAEHQGEQCDGEKNFMAEGGDALDERGMKEFGLEGNFRFVLGGNLGRGVHQWPPDFLRWAAK